MKMFIIEYDYHDRYGEAGSYLSFAKTEEEAKKIFWSWVYPDDIRAGIYITGIDYIDEE